MDNTCVLTRERDSDVDTDSSSDSEAHARTDGGGGRRAALCISALARAGAESQWGGWDSQQGARPRPDGRRATD